MDTDASPAPSLTTLL